MNITPFSTIVTADPTTTEPTTADLTSAATPSSATTTTSVGATVTCAAGADVLTSLRGLFPLAPSVRPPCPALATRIEQVRDLTRQAQHCAKADPNARPEGGSPSNSEPRPVLRTAARALNLAALLAWDCRDDGLFEQIAWDHVNTCRCTPRPAVASARRKRRAC